MEANSSVPFSLHFCKDRLVMTLGLSQLFRTVGILLLGGEEASLDVTLHVILGFGLSV